MPINSIKLKLTGSDKKMINSKLLELSESVPIDNYHKMMIDVIRNITIKFAFKATDQNHKQTTVTLKYYQAYIFNEYLNRYIILLEGYEDSILIALYLSIVAQIEPKL